MTMKTGNNLLLGVTGSIAAYQTPDLAAQLRHDNYEVKTILTSASQEFVTPLSIATMSRGDVFTDDMRVVDTWHPAHIELADWADCALVAPVSAATIGKLAVGIADNLLTEAFLALPQKVSKFIAPAMNGHMLEQPAVQRSLNLLEEDGYTIIEPRTGELACGYEGLGKIASRETIIKTLRKELS